jgi:hypothetical protein
VQEKDTVSRISQGEQAIGIALPPGGNQTAEAVCAIRVPSKLNNAREEKV